MLSIYKFYQNMIYRAMVTAITAAPSQTIEDSGFISIPPFEGKTFGSLRGLKTVTIAMANTNIPKVIAILFRKTMLSKYFRCRIP